MVLFFIVFVFGAMIFHLTKILLGPPPKELARRGEPLGSKLAFLFLLFQMVIVGVVVPWMLKGKLETWIPQGLLAK